MKKALVCILLFLSYIPVNAQCPGPVIGTAVALPAGSFSCVQQSFPSPIGLNSEGTGVTMCFNYYNVGPINLSYLLVNGLCGPFPLYNTLSFTIYDSTCTALTIAGSILPTSVNATISSLTPGTWYTICYTWVPNCPQYSACPLIYTSALPVELLDFKVTAGRESNLIEWSTASQSEVDSFIVEKSWAMDSWMHVGATKGAGSNNTLTKYLMEDTDLSNGILYYRLSERLYSGQINILDIVSLKRNMIPKEEKTYDMLGRTMGRDFRGMRIQSNGTDNKIIVE